jgi:anti-sigma regulatory factor (Ser/Thr protein kinase)
MSGSPNVCLALSNQPDNVVLVRAALTGMAESVGVDGVDLNDIRTAVTEACNNVVLHAYEGEEGPLQLEVYLDARAVEVVVRDHGTGIKPHIRSDNEEALGIGLSIIQALAPRVEFRDVAGGGTEVRMEFATPNAASLDVLVRNGFQPPDVARADLATTSGLAVAPSALARKVLPRVMCVLAARAHFTTDRISDAELVADALVAQVAELDDLAHVRMSVSVEPRSLEVRVRPPGEGKQPGAAGGRTERGLGRVIEKLADERRCLTEGDSEVLALRLRDKR